MGLLDKRRPVLPAPTDTTLESADETPVEQDLATDLSRVTDRSHQTIPDDGSPITITTAQKKKGIGKLTRSGNQSQTSLLIEYFEHGPESGRKPSVRVKVRPSSSKKGRNLSEGHIVVTEAQGTRRPPSHRIALGTDVSEQVLDSNISSLDSEVPFGRHRAPVEIEVNEGSDLSKLSNSPEARYILPASDISSMPGDSMLGVSRPAIITHPVSDSNFSREEMSEKENLKPPIIPTNRNASSERIAQKVIEKISNKPRTSTKSALSDKSRSRSSVSRDVEIAGEPRRRSVKHLEDDSITGTGSSIVSESLLSANPRSMDARSVRSGNSNVSINNPKLLQTVEDAIRRLILPELKEIKKDQKHASHSKQAKDTYPSDVSESSISREEVSRRHSSGKKKRRSSRDHGQRVSSGSRRHERHRKTDDYDSPSEQSYQQSESLDSVSVEDDLKPRKHRKSHRNRDLAAAGLAGAALTAAALKHHDSGSSLDHRERRKKRSKSRSSRSASVVENEEVFHKHGVPPMPMRSDLDTELTRSSLLSSNTNGTATPTRRQVREVVRGSPGELLSSGSQTPSRTPVEKQSPEKAVADIRRGLGTHHGNFSEQDLAAHGEDFDEDIDEEHHRENYQHGFGPIGHGLLTDPERARLYEKNLHHNHPIRRGLSPIQSVASYATTEPNRTSLIQPRSIESFSSPNKEREIRDDISIASMSSAPSTDLAKSRRPQGLSFENRSEIMQPHKGGVGGRARDLGADEYFDEQSDHFRDSYASSDPKITLQHMSNYTDDSTDAPYLDKVIAGQNLGQGYGANPEYVHTPPGVESAVASLYESSVLDNRGTQSPRTSQAGSSGSRGLESPNKLDREAEIVKTGSPLKHQYSFDGDEQVKETIHNPYDSTPQSPAQFFEEVDQPAPVLSRSAEKLGDGQGVEEDAQASPESEITTNPSVIQGPIAGYPNQSRDHWPYGPTPPPAPAVILPPALPEASREISTANTNLVPEALSINHPPATDSKTHVAAVNATPPGGNDEGYETGVTGANAPSPVVHERAMAPPAPFSPGLQLDTGLDEEDDPFTTGKRNQYVSGLSQGMSPLYDSATGRGVDRIQSKDVVALMDHLTVRDAQRNARDTEILMTLVTTAAEMRNSFQDMKKFITDQGDEIMDTADQQHEKTQKAIGGPRPQPAPPSARFARASQSEDEESLPAKRGNVFRRALRGLGTKNTQELQNIEGMLMQLLDDVDSLRGLQLPTHVVNEPRSTSFNSADHAHPPTDPGYEPEGQAGTSSTGDRSGIFSNNSSRQANYRGLSAPPGTGNRVSTVIERDEEYDDEDDLPDDGDLQTTPRASYREQDPRHVPGSSVPLHTPPRLHDSNQGTLSNENTPNYSMDGSSGKKKSFASSFLPKMVSRWSKTTASSAGDYRASTQTKARPYSQVSHSGSNIPEYDYDPQGDDRLRSNTSFQNQQYGNEENRPPSPLMPSQVSDNPKYQAHRNSLNLQHPQPRQGPTGRFQNRLENEAQYYDNDPLSPTSVTSSQWENQAALSGMPGPMPNGDYRHGGQLSPISDGGYSETSEAMLHRDGRRGVRSSGSASSLRKQGPPRPPKILDDDPLVPQRPSKTMMSPSGSRQATYVDHVAAARAGSPAYDKVIYDLRTVKNSTKSCQSPVSALRTPPAQNRKPSGPRPLSSSGQYSKGQKGDLNMIKKTRFRGSPYQIDSEENLA